MQPIDMHVDDIEFGRVPGHRFQQRCLAIGSVRGRPRRSARGQTAWSWAEVFESPLANSVTSCPKVTSSSTSHATTRSVPP